MLTKKIGFYALILVLFSLTTACGSTGSSSGAGVKIKPGDRVGSFLVTTGVEGKFTYGFNVDCSGPGDNNTYTCNASVGEVINVSTGLYDDTGAGNLDEVWLHSNYQLYIDDRPVDLAAFGTIEYDHPQVGVIRFANVVITTDKPGEITVRDSGLFDNGDPFASTSTYNFTEP